MKKMDQVIEHCHNMTKPGGHLVLSQAFLKHQEYGRNIADGFDGVVGMFLKRYPQLQLVEAKYDFDSSLIE